jgi:hypothetical protein
MYAQEGANCESDSACSVIISLEEVLYDKESPKSAVKPAVAKRRLCYECYCKCSCRTTVAVSMGSCISSVHLQCHNSLFVPSSAIYICTEDNVTKRLNQLDVGVRRRNESVPNIASLCSRVYVRERLSLHAVISSTDHASQ